MLISLKPWLLTLGRLKDFLSNLRAADVVLIGSGLGEDGAASQAMDLVLANIRADQNLVVDGSALNLLAKKNKKDLPDCHLTLTPHQKEWERLSGLRIPEQTVSNTQKALGEFRSWDNPGCQESQDGCLSG